MSDKQYSKVEEEIIQILNQMDDSPAQEKPSNVVNFRPRPKSRREVTLPQPVKISGVLQRVRRYSAGSWVGVGIVAALIAWQLGRFVPILGMIGMFASIGAFMAALYTWRVGSVPGLPTAPGGTKRWRGRDIDLSSSRQSPGITRNKRWGSRFRGPRP